MAITSFSVDYSGRTIDINLLRVATYTNNQTQPATVEFGNPSQFTAGINKLVQKYAILFLTELNSQVNTPDFGTAFLATAKGGTGLTRIDIRHLFNFANLDVLKVMRTYQANNPSIPTDEQLQSANMTSFSVVGTTLSLSIAITSVAGTSVTFILPIPLNN